MEIQKSTTLFLSTLIIDKNIDLEKQFKLGTDF